MADKNTLRLLILQDKLRSFARAEVEVQVQIPAGLLAIFLLRFFISVIVFVPFGLFPFILIADP